MRSFASRFTPTIRIRLHDKTQRPAQAWSHPEEPHCRIVQFSGGAAGPRTRLFYRFPGHHDLIRGSLSGSIEVASAKILVSNANRSTVNRGLTILVAVFMVYDAAWSFTGYCIGEEDEISPIYQGGSAINSLAALWMKRIQEMFHERPQYD